MAKLYLNAADVAEIMDCSENYGYKIIAELNTELKSKGYIVRAGRIPKKYFYERAGLDLEEKTNGNRAYVFYGRSGHRQIPGYAVDYPSICIFILGCGQMMTVFYQHLRP